MLEIKNVLVWATNSTEIHYIFFSLLGGIIGWVLKCLKTKHEISKLKVDIIEKKMEITEKLQSVRNKYNEKNKEFENILQEFIVSMQKRKIDECVNLRLKLNSFFFSDYLKSFCDYIDISLDYYSNDRKGIKQTVFTEMIAVLKIINKYLNVINRKDILNKLEVEEIIISKETLFYFKCKFKEYTTRLSQILCKVLNRPPR